METDSPLTGEPCGDPPPPLAGEAEEDAAAPVVTIFVTVAGEYAAIAALVLQIDVLRHRIGVRDGTERLVAFSTAVALMYVAHVTCLVLQSYLLAALSPQRRVALGQALMALSHALATLLWYAGPRPLSTAVAGVAAVFIVCGCGMGIARPNVLAVVSLFGRRANRFSALGTTVGFNATTMGVYGLTWIAGGGAREWLGLSLFLHVGTFVVCGAGCVLMLRLSPPAGSDDLHRGGTRLLRHLPVWREWVPPARYGCTVFALAAFSLSFIDGVFQLVYHPRSQAVVPGVLTVPPAGVMTLFCVVGFVGGWAGSMAATLRRPLAVAVALSFVCVVFTLSKVPLLALLGGLVPYASCVVYATVPAQLRDVVHPAQLTAATTLFVLFGDIARFLALAASGPWANIVGVSGP